MTSVANTVFRKAWSAYKKTLDYSESRLALKRKGYKQSEIEGLLRVTFEQGYRIATELLKGKDLIGEGAIGDTEEENIIKAACIYWKISRNTLTLRTQERAVVQQKGIIYCLLRTYCNSSYQSMAQLLGYKAHQPVMRMVRTIKQQKKIVPAIRDSIDQIMKIHNQL